MFTGVTPDIIWFPPQPYESDGEMGHWSPSADVRHIAREPEHYTDPTYTAEQIALENRVLTVSAQANLQRGPHQFDFEGFYVSWED